MVFWWWAEALLYPLLVLQPSEILGSSSALWYTYRKHNRNPSPHGLAAVQLGRIADPDVLLAIALPTYHRRTVEQYFHRVATWETCNGTALLKVHVGLWASPRCGYRGRLVGALHDRGEIGKRFDWYGLIDC